MAAEGRLKYGELFAGVGGLSLGLDRAGFECAFHAEIDSFPRRVLKARWPNTPLLGDVEALAHGRKMKRWMLERYGDLDILTGGSPCQDLSVAGKRKGLDGDRSRLFYSQMRLWKMLGTPLCLWENVDGALSSNKGADFAAVLSAFVGGTVIVPRSGWRRAGVVSGPTGVAAWRLLDAQFFGVPQRRRRVFVLGSRTNRIDPAKVLLEPGSLRGDREKGRRARKGTPQGSGSGAAQDGEPHTFEWHNQDSRIRPVRVAASLNQNADGREGHLVLETRSAATFDPVNVTNKDNRSEVNFDKPAHTLHSKGMHVLERRGAIPLDMRNATRTTSKDEVNRQGVGVGEDGDPSPTLTEFFTPGVLAFGTQDSGDVLNVSPTLRAGGSRTSNPNGGVMPSILHVAFNETGHERWSKEEVIGSLNAHEAKEAHSVILEDAYTFKPSHFTRGKDGAPSSVVPPLSADADKGDQDNVVIGALTVRPQRQSAQDATSEFYPVENGIPRRLLPVECERLMGWPDGWTDVPDGGGRSASDSARYKACGNGVVSNVIEWIALRLLAHLSETSPTETGA